MKNKTKSKLIIYQQYTKNYQCFFSFENTRVIVFFLKTRASVLQGMRTRVSASGHVCNYFHYWGMYVIDEKVKVFLLLGDVFRVNI